MTTVSMDVQRPNRASDYFPITWPKRAESVWRAALTPFQSPTNREIRFQLEKNPGNLSKAMALVP
jgi:hypothetical protein